MTPSPSFLHQEVVGRLHLELSAYLEGTGPGLVILSPSDVQLDDESLVQPDILVVAPREHMRLKRDGFPVREILLAIEVLSRSSVRADRVVKRMLYQQHSIEYWIVDLESRVLERWGNDEERSVPLSGLLRWQPLSATQPFEMDLTEFFDGLLGDLT